MVESASTDKLQLVTGLVRELSPQLSEVSVEWESIDTWSGSVIVPVVELRFKNGERKTVKGS